MSQISIPAKDKKFIKDIYEIVFNNKRHSMSKYDFEIPIPVESSGGLGWQIKLKPEHDIFKKKINVEVEFIFQPEKNSNYYIYLYPNSNLQPSAWTLHSDAMKSNLSEKWIVENLGRQPSTIDYIADNIIIWIETIEEEKKIEEEFKQYFYNEPKIDFNNLDKDLLKQELNTQQIDLTRFILKEIEKAIVKHSIPIEEFKQLKEDVEKQLEDKPTIGTLRNIYDAVTLLLNLYIASTALPPEIMVNVNGGFALILKPLEFIMQNFDKLFMLLRISS